MQSAIKSARERGAQPELSAEYFRFTEVIYKQGDLPNALEQTLRRRKLFAEMKMNWWSEQTKALRARIERGQSSPVLHRTLRVRPMFPLGTFILFRPVDQASANRIAGPRGRQQVQNQLLRSGSPLLRPTDLPSYSE